MTTVSQKTPVDPTSAGLTAFLAFPAAEAIGAEPMPASLENKPLATPYRIAISNMEPTKPPAMALGVKAELIIREMVAGR